MSISTSYQCDICSKPIDEAKENIAAISIYHTTMTGDPKIIILCEKHARDLEIVLRRWWKDTYDNLAAATAARDSSDVEIVDAECSDDEILPPPNSGR